MNTINLSQSRLNKMRINGTIIILFIGLILVSCGQNNTNKNTGLVDNKAPNMEVQLDTSMVAMLPFDTTKTWIFENARQTELSINDLIIIEDILTGCISEYNTKQKQLFKELKSNNLESNLDIKHFIIDLERYKRQYMAVINDKGEKEVWINCFCDSWGKNWREEQIIIKDGGNCYFNLKINIRKKKYYDFMVNGYA